MGKYNGAKHDAAPERNKRNKLKFILIVCGALVVQGATAQDNRLLFHYSRYKEVIYNVGDVISFRTKGSEEKVTWRITEITDTTIMSGERSLAPYKIGAMYVDQKTKIFFPFRFKYMPILIGGGVAYFLIDSFNSKEINRSAVIVSTSMVGAGLIAGLLIKPYIKLKPGRKLVILR
jgi:hypothetical protein